jgi:GPH family glycoside/pentoside/hexuronide:cation symporter
MIYKLCQVFGERVFQGLLFYVGLYYVCQGDKSKVGELLFLGGLLGSVLTVLLLPFLKAFSMKLGKRAGLITASVTALVLLLSQPLLLTPKAPYLLLIPMLMLPLLSIISNVLLNAIVPDICDMDELEHGERREGLFTAVVAFMGKLEISLALGIVGGLLWVAGVNESSPVQTDAVITKLMWLTVAPGVFFTACALIASWRFKMGEAEVNEIRDKLAMRRDAKAALTGSDDATPQ